MNKAATFARRVFLWAGIYGIIVLAPQFFLEEKLGRDFPPPPNHPEQFYGFLSVALAWQFAFLVIARDPVRYRLLMLPAVVEKWLFAIIALVLYFQGRVAVPLLVFTGIDFGLGFLFLVSYWRCGEHGPKT